jgi:hypothetical protein
MIILEKEVEFKDFKYVIAYLKNDKELKTAR